MRIKSNNRQTISKKAAARKCSRLFAYILCTMKTEMRVLTSARRRTRSGGPRTARTGAECRHRIFEPRPTLEKKNDTDLVSFFFQARDGDRTPSSLANPVNTRRTAHCLLSVYKLSTNISKRLIESKIYQPFYSSFFSINLSKLTSNATEIL